MVPLVLATVGTVLGPAAAATNATRTVVRSAAFHTQDQSLWGPTAGEGLTGDAPFFDSAWNETGSVGDIATICIVPNPFGGCIQSAKFGAKLGGSTNGRVGLGAHYELGAGALAIDYPARVQFQMPESFTPGKWMTISSSATSLPGGAIVTESPDGHIDLNGVFGFYADAKAEACVVDCDDSTSSINIPESSGTIFTIDNETVHTFSALELERLGLSGYVQLPNLAVGPTTVNSDGTLSAAGRGEYAELGISAIEWAMKLAGLELPINFDLPMCCGMSAGWTTFDSTFSATAAASQALRFVPRVRVSLTLPRAMSYVVHKRNGDALTGRGETISFWPGEAVDIRVPFNQTRRFAIQPSANISRSVLRNTMTTDVSFGGGVEALEAHATVPSYPPIWPGVNLTLGPVYALNYPIAAIPPIQVWTDSWRVGGFTTATMKPFVMQPS